MGFSSYFFNHIICIEAFVLFKDKIGARLGQNGKIRSSLGQQLLHLHMNAYDGEVKVVLSCSNTHYKSKKKCHVGVTVSGKADIFFFYHLCKLLPFKHESDSLIIFY